MIAQPGKRVILNWGTWGMGKYPSDLVTFCFVTLWIQLYGEACPLPLLRLCFLEGYNAAIEMRKEFIAAIEYCDLLPDRPMRFSSPNGLTTRLQFLRFGTEPDMLQA